VLGGPVDPVQQGLEMGRERVVAFRASQQSGLLEPSVPESAGLAPRVGRGGLIRDSGELRDQFRQGRERRFHRVGSGLERKEASLLVGAGGAQIDPRLLSVDEGFEEERRFFFFAVLAEGHGAVLPVERRSPVSSGSRRLPGRRGPDRSR